MLRGITGIASMLLAGCTVTSTDGRGRTHYYVGLVRLVFPDDAGRATVSAVQTLGAGFDGALFLGWRDNRLVHVHPEECRVIIVLRNKAEREHVSGLVKALGEQPCIADISR